MNLPECKASKTHKEIVRIMVSSIPNFKDGQATSNTKARAPLPGFSGVIWDEWGKKGVRMDTKALKKQMGAAIAMVLVAAVALGSATFAWFVNNTKVTAESVNVTAKSANTLLISHDGTAWGTTATFASAESKTFVPVSSTSQLSFFKDKTWTTEATTGEYNASAFQAATEGTDYYKDSFKVKASQDCGLYLDTDTKFTTTGDADVLKSMRLALKIGDSVFFYQVDADAIAGDGNSYNTTLKSLNADGVTTAISAENAAAAIAAANMAESKVPSLAASLVTAPADSTTLVDKDDNKKLCDLAANQVKNIDVYVWMEGCDFDCNSAVVKKITDQAVKVSLGFCAGRNA